MQPTTNVIVFVPLNKNNFDQMQIKYILLHLEKQNLEILLTSEMSKCDVIANLKKKLKDLPFQVAFLTYFF